MSDKKPIEPVGVDTKKKLYLSSSAHNVSDKRGRRSEKGNVFFTLFGAVAVVGILGAGIMATMRGPLSSMVEVQHRTQAEAEMSIAAKLVLLEASEQADDGDCDGDGFVEPLEFLSATPNPVGGGQLPAAVGSNKTDPWGTPYGYCGWNAGGTASAGGCGADLLDGNGGPADETYTIIAVVSAGPDQAFQTTCTGGGSPEITKTAGSDDLWSTYNYTEATIASGGLWNIKSGEPDVAEIDKNLEVTGGATFTDVLNLTGASAQLQLGAASLVLPTDVTLPNTACDGDDAANNLLLRINTTTDPETLELCDNSGGSWVSVAQGSSLWQQTGSDIYYSAGNVGIGVTNPDDNLDVDGTFQLTGAATIGGNVNLANGNSVVWASGADVTESSGNLQLDAAGGSVELTLGSASAAFLGDVTITGTTSNASASALVVKDSGASDLFVVQNDGDVGIGVSDPNDALDVAGSADVTQYYAIDGNTVLNSDSTVPDTILVGNVAGANITTGDNNTIVGGSAGATLEDGEYNILVGSGVDVAAANTSNYLNIGNTIIGTMGANPATPSSGNASLTVQGDWNVANDLTVTGNTTLSSGATVNGTLTVASTNFNVTGCGNGEVLKYDTGVWACSADAGGGSGGSGQNLADVLTVGNDAGGLNAEDFGKIGADEYCAAGLSGCVDADELRDAAEIRGELIKSTIAGDTTTDGQFLMWSQTNSQWQVGTLAGLGVNDLALDGSISATLCDSGETAVSNGAGDWVCGDAGDLGGTSVGAIDDLNDAKYDTATDFNLFIGHEGGSVGANDDYNLAIGQAALDALNNTGGGYNTAVGYGTLSANTSGDANTAIGSSAMAWNVTGGANVAIGQNSLFANTSGSNNIAIGIQAQRFNTVGSYNTAIGTQVLFSNTQKSGNTAVGYQSMYYADSNTSSSNTYNTALGYQSLYGSGTATNNTGTLNTALGTEALKVYTSGGANVAVGYQAGDNLTVENRNILIGASGIDTNGMDDYLNIGNAIYGDMGTTTATGTGDAAITIDGALAVRGALDLTTYGSGTNAGTATYLLASDVSGNVIEVDPASVGSSVTFGTDNQVPFTNATGDDFDYSANFTFDGTDLEVGTSSGYIPLVVHGPITFGSTGDEAVNKTGNITSRYAYAAGEIALIPFGSSSPTIFSPNGGVTIGTQTANPPAEGLIVEGNVGIGTSVPDAKLYVKNDTSTKPAIIATGAAGQTDNLQEWWQNGGVVEMAAVDVSGSFFTRSATGYQISNGTLWQLKGDSNSFDVYNGSAGQIRFTVSDGGVLAIPAYGSGTNTGTATYLLAADASGNVIEVNPASVGSIAADSLDFSDFKDAMTLDASTNIAASGTNVLSITNTGTGNSFLVNDQAADTTPFVINASGDVGIGTTTPTAGLDIARTVSVGQPILLVRDSTAPNDYFAITEGTSVANQYVPIFDGKATGAHVGRAGLFFRGDVNQTGDDYGIIFRAQQNGTFMSAGSAFEFMNYTTSLLNIDEAGDIRINGDLTVVGDDLFMTTNTAGYLLVADGTNFNPVAVTGDVTISGSGATTIGADKILESHLKSVNAATDEHCLTYESTTGDFEWQDCDTVTGPSFGTDNQVPFTNAAGDDFDYSANFTFNGSGLTVARSGTTLGEIIRLNNAGTPTNGQNDMIAFYNTSGAADFMGAVAMGFDGGTNDAAKQLGFYVSDILTPKMVVEGSGNVGINNTAPDAFLSIEGQNANNYIKFMTGDSSTTYNGIDIVLTDNSVDNFGTAYFYMNPEEGISLFSPQSMYLTSGAHTYIDAGSGLYITGNIKFEDYGSGTNTGTATYLLAADASGNVIEVDPASVGSSVTLGTDNQVPFTNATGDDFDYSANFTFNGTALSVDNSSVVFNESGADVDYRIEGDADANLFYVDAGNGRIGIGTATPGYKLDVSGSINASSQIRGDSFLLYNNKAIYFSKTDTSLDAYIYRDTSNDLRITTLAGNILMGNGNVGIGATAPSSKLHVATTGETVVRVEADDADSLVTFIDAGNVGVSVGLDFSDSRKFKIGSGGLASSWLAFTSAGYLALPSYGSGAITGTATYNLAVDASGNVIEVATGGGGASSLDDLSDARHDATNLNLFIGHEGVVGDIGNEYAVYNTAVGIGALDSLDINIESIANTALGYNALTANSSGAYNTASGGLALRFNTTGGSNTANGAYALYANTTGSLNTASGFYALGTNTTGSNNLAQGSNAGRYITDGSTANATGADSVFLGSDTRAAADGETNQIVIGSGAIGAGSNSVTLGNDSITTTLLKGNVGIGTTSLSQKLTVAGNIALANGGYVYGNSTGVYLRLDNATYSELGYSSTTAIRADGSAVTMRGTAGAERMRINADGTVGIGTSLPTAALHIENATSPQVKIKTTSATATDYAGINFLNGNNAQANIYLRQNTYTPINNAKAAQIVIDSNGAGGVLLNAANASGTIDFVTATYASAFGSVLAMRVDSDASLILPEYGDGTFTGTATYNLAVDASGNVIEVATGGGASSLDDLSDARNDASTRNLFIGHEGIVGGSLGDEIAIDNTAVGFGALVSLVLGDEGEGTGNTALGSYALNQTTRGIYNTALGYLALQYMTTGSGNTALGVQAGRYSTGFGVNQTGSNSVFLGNDTKAGANGQTNQIVIGYNATGAGSNSVVLGNDSITTTVLKGALDLTTYGSGTNTGTATYNLAVDASGNVIEVATGGGGASEIDDLSDARHDATNLNLFIGHEGVVGDVDNELAVYNTAVGIGALDSLDAGDEGNENTALGYSALTANTTGASNVASGALTLYSNTTGSNNTANGVRALYLNTTGASNTASGGLALISNTTGSNNTANGLGALYSNTTGAHNTASGLFALNSNTTGDNNTALGSVAGRFITNGSTGNTTGSNSVFLGYDTRAAADGQTNQIVIGYNAIGAGSNSVTLGNTSITTTVLRGGIDLTTYGSGTNTGTATYNLAVDASGNVIEVATGGGVSADSLDFDDFMDNMTLDASTDIAASGTNVLSITNTGSGNSFLVNDQASDTTPFIIDAEGDVGIGSTTIPAQISFQITRSGSDLPQMLLRDADITFPNYSSLGGFWANPFNALWGPTSSSSGGAQLSGLTGSGQNAGLPLYFAGYHGGTSPTTAAINIAGWRHDGGTSRTALTGTMPVFDISAGSTNIFRIVANGQMTASGYGSGTKTGTATYNLAVDSSGNVIEVATGGGVSADSLDFDDFMDNMTLDASTNIAASGTNVLSITNTGTGNSFLVNDQAGDTTPFVINASGDVGIGVSSPSAALEVSKTVTSGQDLLVIKDPSAPNDYFKITEITSLGGQFLPIFDGKVTGTGADRSGLFFRADVNQTGDDYGMIFRAQQASSFMTAGMAFKFMNYTNNLLTIDEAGDTVITGDLTVTGDDLFMATNTAGYLLVADGTNYNPVAVTGDVTISGSGVTTIGADKILESHLKAVNAATDEHCLTYESTTGDFEWQACGGGSSFGTDNQVPFTNAGGTDFDYSANFTFSGTALSVDNSSVVFNDSGADVDYRIEGDTDANLFYVDAGNDRVGIGTATPSAKLDVAATGSNFLVAPSGTYAYNSLSSQAANSLILANPQTDWSQSFSGITIPGGTSFGTAEAGQWTNIGSFRASAGGGVRYFSSLNGGSHSHIWYHNRSEQMRLTYGGNLGIGTDSPSTKLHVATTGETVVRVEADDADSLVTFIDSGNVGASVGLDFSDSRKFKIGSGGFASSWLAFTSSGYLALPSYGSGSVTGTATYNLAVDASGNVIEVATGGGGASAIDDLSDGAKDSGLFILFLGHEGTGAVTAEAVYNTAVGVGALDAVNNEDASANTAIGADALTANTSGADNTAVGSTVLSSNTTGMYNTAIGSAALSSNTSGNANTAIGFQAGRYITNGSTANATGANSVFLGGDTKAAADGQTNQIVIGYNAIGAGSNSVVLGNTSITTTVLRGGIDLTTYGSGTNTGTATYNLAVDASGNVIEVATGGGASAIDGLSDAKKDTTDNNLFIAHEGGGSLPAGAIQNTVVGIGALDSINSASADNNTAYGYEALTTNTSGASNTAFGRYTLRANTTSSLNTAIGVNVLYLSTGDSNTAVGANALNSNTSGNQNTALGVGALQEGKQKSGNTAIGYQSMYYADSNLSTGNTYNTAVGYQSLRGSTTALNNTGALNTALGPFALYAYTSGTENIATGYNAGVGVTSGSYNTLLGSRAGVSLTTGSYNIVLGMGADVPSATGNDQLVIGTANAGEAIKGTIGTGDLSAQGTGWSFHSDERLKKDIRDVDGAVQNLEKIRGVLFKWNDVAQNADKDHDYYGVIAQEVQAVFPDMVKTRPAKDGEPEYLEVNYTAFTPVLIEAAKELAQENDTLKGEIADIRESVETLRAVIENRYSDRSDSEVEESQSIQKDPSANARDDKLYMSDAKIIKLMLIGFALMGVMVVFAFWMGRRSAR